MQGEEGDQNVDMAMKEPERFVAKPQREGGGKCPGEASHGMWVVTMSLFRKQLLR